MSLALGKRLGRSKANVAFCGQRQAVVLRMEVQ
jgi:hypothetical protein